MGVGLEKDLVDSEGFPLANVDLYQARLLRGETGGIYAPLKACNSPNYVGLINDYKATMNQIEMLLPVALPTEGPSPSLSTSLKPFARVAEIQKGSVAHRHGILVGDQIVKVNNTVGLESMTKVAKIIDECREQGKPLKLALLRGGGSSAVEIIIPYFRESLGCHIVPLSR